jgi:hypothetical protein
MDVLPALLPRCNAFFVSFRKQKIPIYVRPGVFLAKRTRLGRFIHSQFLKPGERSAPMPGAFSNGGCAK